MSTDLVIRENIHAETYAHFLRLFIKDADEQARLFYVIETIPTVRAKTIWCFQWFNRDACPFSVRLIAFAILEGIFFCSSFAAIYCFRERGILPGLCFSNELIARDKYLHMRFACLLYAELRAGIPVPYIHKMVQEAVDLEKASFSGKCLTYVFVSLVQQ